MSTVAFVAKAPWVWLALLALAWTVGTAVLWPSPLGYAFIALAAITFAACVVGRVALASYVARERSPVFETFDIPAPDDRPSEGPTGEGQQRRQEQRQRPQAGA
jgi:hypothetical protein